MKWCFRYRKPLMVLLTLFFILFIFSNSLQNGTDSGNRSGWVTQLFNQFLSVFHLSVTEHFIRKAAHFSEYFVLGGLLLLTLRAFTKNMGQMITAPLFIGLLVPVCDESLQLLIPGRAGMVSDVLIDFSGVICGIFLCWILLLFIRSIYQRMHPSPKQKNPASLT